MTSSLADIKFGTDGWRAIMGKEYTPENVERMAQAFCDYTNGVHRSSGKTNKPKVVVGYDFRKDSENFAALTASILIANGIETVLSDCAVPTPAVSRWVMDHKFDLGIAITASHNPGNYNGFKVKDANGSSAEPAITKGIEGCLDRSAVRKASPEEVKSSQKDLMTPYLDAVKKYLKLELFNRKPLNILVDSMHGMGESHIEQILAGTAVKVTTLRAKRDVTFGGTAPEPITKNFPETCEKMKSGKYDAAFITDGDSDRIGAARVGGIFVSPGTLLSLIMLHLAEDLKMHGDVVTTVSNTALIYRVAKQLGLTVHETPVGFKHIVDVMRKHDVLIAGEESGGLAFKNYMQERDGVLSALLIIQMMEHRQMTLEEILADVDKRFGKFLYSRRDLHYPEAAKAPFLKHLTDLSTADASKAIGIPCEGKNLADGVKFVMHKDAWLLFRMSGTEPLLRIYAESQVPGEAETLVSWGEKVAVSLQG
jgi:phosphomannomutase